LYKIWLYQMPLLTISNGHIDHIQCPYWPYPMPYWPYPMPYRTYPMTILTLSNDHIDHIKWTYCPYHMPILSISNALIDHTKWPYLAYQMYIYRIFWLWGKKNIFVVIKFCTFPWQSSSATYTDIHINILLFLSPNCLSFVTLYVNVVLGILT
jgi:hypothetical protein